MLAPLGLATAATGQRAGPHLLPGGPGRAAPDAARELEVRVRGEVERAASGRRGSGRGRGAAAGAREEVVLVVGAVGGRPRVGVEEGGGRGGRREEREDREVFPQRGDGVADGGQVAAPRARQRGAGGGREHAGEARAAEAVAAVEEQRRPLVLVVPDVAQRAARHPHRARRRWVPGGAARCPRARGGGRKLQGEEKGLDLGVGVGGLGRETGEERGIF